MTIHYKVLKMAQPGVKGGGNYLYYPRIHERKKIGIKEIATRISNKCTLRRADIVATLVALTEEIPQLLMDNCNIHLGDLGILSIHATGKPSASEEEVNEAKITDLTVAFRPSNDIKRLLKTTGFKRSKKKG